MTLTPQRDNGSIVLGGSLADIADADVDAVRVALLAAGAKLLPALRPLADAAAVAITSNGGRDGGNNSNQQDAAAAAAAYCRTTMGNRPFPADGLPLIGWVPGECR